MPYLIRYYYDLNKTLKLLNHSYLIKKNKEFFMSYGVYSSSSSRMEDFYRQQYETSNKERNEVQQKLWTAERELSSQKTEVTKLQRQMDRLTHELSQLKTESKRDKESHQREIKNLKDLNQIANNSPDEMQKLFNDTSDQLAATHKKYVELLGKYANLYSQYEKLLANAKATKEVFEKQKCMIADLQGQIQQARNDSAKKEDQIQMKDAENQLLQAEIARLSQQLEEKQAANETQAAAAPSVTPTTAIGEVPATISSENIISTDDAESSDDPAAGPGSPRTPPPTPPAYAFRTVAEEDGRRQEWLEKCEASAKAEEDRRREEEAQRIRDLQNQAYLASRAQEMEEEEPSRRRSYSYSRQNSTRQLNYRY